MIKMPILPNLYFCNSDRTSECAVSYVNIIILQVSFGSELSNRAPTFDMDLSDFMDGDKPISYEKARDFFCQDPSQK